MYRFFTFIFLALSQITTAQYTLTGKVTSSDDEALINAHIAVQGPENRLVTSDAEGMFRVENLPAGAYEVAVSYIGFQQSAKHLDLSGVETVVGLNFRLSPNSSLDEILVSSVRAYQEDPFTYSNIDGEELNERNMGQDVPMLLQHMPGVISSSDAGAGIGYTYMRVRGSDATKINVTINGIPYNDAESQGTFWVDIPDIAGSAESIQLQRGVGTSTNGPSAFGASLNLLTDTYSKNPYATVSTSLGSFNSHKASVKFSTGSLDDHLEISGRVSDIYSDGYIDRAFADLQGYNFQATYHDDNRVIKALTFGGKERTYQAWYGITPEQLEDDRRQNPYTYENEVDDYGQDHYQFHWNEKFSEAWSAKLGLNYTHGSGFFEQYKEGESPADFADIVQPTEADGTTDLIVRRWLNNHYYVTNFSVSRSGTIDMELGTSWSWYDGLHYGEVIWAKAFATDHFINDRYYTSDADKNEKSAFAKFSYTWSGVGDFYLDLQGRHVDYKTGGMTSDNRPIDVDTMFTFFNPKVGFSKRMGNKVAYISYARAHREPNREDFKNSVNDHETLDNIELGIRGSTGEWSYATNFYYMYYRNQLVLTGAINDVGAPIRDNSGKSYRLGLELEAAYQFTPLFSISGNLALSQNKNIDFRSEYDGMLVDWGDTDISFSPPVIANVGVKYLPIDGLSLSVFNKYVSEQYMSNIESPISKLPDYFTTDALLQYEIQPKKIIDRLTLKLAVYNLWNAEYVDRGFYYAYDDTWTDPDNIMTVEGVGYYPQATRHFMIGMDINF